MFIDFPESFELLQNLVHINVSILFGLLGLHSSDGQLLLVSKKLIVSDFEILNTHVSELDTEQCTYEGYDSSNDQTANDLLLVCQLDW